MSSIEFSMADVSKDDVNARCDYVRHKILEFLAMRGEATVFTIANFLSMPPENVRSHTKLLINMKCMEKRKEGTQTFYSATGVPYEMKRRTPTHKVDAIKALQKTPNARIIRLLDRNPSEISKEEHKANRRKGAYLGVSSSTMGMFDTF